MIYLKAFDSLSHTILLKKMRKLRIDTFWFEDYLNERTQAVRIDNIISSKLSIEYGVPQGSIIGPVLFNILVNDMIDGINDCVLVQYADDTQFLHCDRIH